MSHWVIKGLLIISLLVFIAVGQLQAGVIPQSLSSVHLQPVPTSFAEPMHPLRLYVGVSFQWPPQADSKNQTVLNSSSQTSFYVAPLKLWQQAMKKRYANGETYSLPSILRGVMTLFGPPIQSSVEETELV